ncbi:MAG: proteasome assembly chaperone 4 family protein [Candidatus Bathyarchaeota archaeon]|nr:proteasome assembly chaperone 4 family protein [Candidatus Bathyarchaeota archaeon]MDH5494420.1 proteasome assembly chaperone 4 family protein [Candidatus Bathyarchaeota archaeon]
MPRATIVKEEILEKNMRLLAIYIETKNAVLVLLSEAEDQLGTLAASVPPTAELIATPLLSSVLLGDRNTTTARMLAERLANKTGKIGLVSIYLKTISETEANPVLMKLFEKVTTVNKAEQEHREGESVSI